jgi:hypothetical protein
MATWTTIPDTALEPGKPARSVDALALRDNDIYIANTHGMQVFTTSDTFTPKPGIATYKVVVIGGGGGGGGDLPDGSSLPGGAGGYGGISVGYLYNVISTVTVKVGTGGAGGTTANNGASGGASSVLTISASGGGGGKPYGGGLASNGTGAGGVLNSTFNAPFNAGFNAGINGNYGIGGGSGTAGKNGIVIIEW